MAGEREENRVQLKHWKLLTHYLEISLHLKIYIYSLVLAIKTSLHKITLFTFEIMHLTH